MIKTNKRIMSIRHKVAGLVGLGALALALAFGGGVSNHSFQTTAILIPEAVFPSGGQTQNAVFPSAVFPSGVTPQGASQAVFPSGISPDAVFPS